MLTYPEIDPVAIDLGTYNVFGSELPLQVHWYGLMYLFGFASAWLLGVYRASKPHTPINRKQMEDLVFYGALGTVIGGRLGYIVFYNFESFAQTPSILFRVWEGGMSFHGGLIGVVTAVFLFSRKVRRPFIDVMDFSAPLIPLALGFGRIGNFIGGELWGRVSDVPWAMVFPKGGDDPRHPSQLYQAFLEGVVLFAILFWFSRKPRPRYTVSALFLIVYGALRFGVEFVREPDSHIGLAFDWMSRGQLLSIPMVVLGIVIFVVAYRNAGTAEQATEADRDKRENNAKPSRKSSKKKAKA